MRCIIVFTCVTLIFFFFFFNDTATTEIYTLSLHDALPIYLNTFYLVTNYRSESPALLSKASAALFVTKKLGDPWRWLRLFGVFPSALLDRAYDLTARYRYRLFGRYESCLMPSAEYKKRFIDP